MTQYETLVHELFNKCFPLHEINIERSLPKVDSYLKLTNTDYLLCYN